MAIGHEKPRKENEAKREGEEASRALMLWDDDFIKRNWKAICESLGLPEDTQEVELKVRVIAHFPYKHGRTGDGEVDGKCKMCPRQRICSDECYGENPCDFALAFDRIGKRIDLKTACVESLREEQDERQKTMPERRIFGDYVLNPALNAFNGKASWWISKRGFTVARYCFSASEEAESERQIKDGLAGYISLLEGTLQMFEDKKCESGSGEMTWKDGRWNNWKECPYCGSSIQQAEDFERTGLYEFCPRCGKRMSAHA